MRTLRWKLLPLALLLTLVAVALTARSVVAGQEPTRAARGARVSVLAIDTKLSQIRAEPLPWLGRRVRFVLQLQEVQESWNPYLTRFGSAEWVAFSGWSDERFTWDPAVHGDPHRRLFARRGSALEAILNQTSPYQRLEVVATVRELFLDEAWLEVEELHPLSGHVGEGTLLHVGRAREFMGRGQWELALQQFERAMAAPLPRHARAELDRHVAVCSRAWEAQRGVAREAGASAVER